MDLPGSNLRAQIRDTRATVSHLTVAEVARYAGVEAAQVLQVESDAETIPVGLVSRVANAVGLKLCLEPIKPEYQSRLSEAYLDF